MNTKADIDLILAQEHVAVAGVSTNRHKFGSVVFRHMKKHGYQVYPLNPKHTTYDGVECYPDPASLPAEVTAMVMVTKPEVTLKLVGEAAARGIRYIWMQQGAESAEAVALAKENDMVAITGKCIMMFAEPVKSVHRFHRSLSKLFRTYPK